MEKEQQTKRRRQRKALLVLPLVTIPFLTLAFWALGGGKGASDKVQMSTGLNLHLPDPQLKEAKGQDKLSFYQEAEKDAERQKKQALMDRYLPDGEALSLDSDKPVFEPAPYMPGEGADANEEKVYRKLALLQKRLQTPSPVPAHTPTTDRPLHQVLESATPLVPGAAAGEDPQLEQLNAMMDKILDIQHPERVKARNMPAIVPGVRKEENLLHENRSLTISLIAPAGNEDGYDMNDFFFSTRKEANDAKDNTIEAVIHGTQILANGSLVKLRLMEAITIGDIIIPSGTFLFGSATQRQERLHVNIATIRYQESLYPLQLALYDMDGLEGIHVAGPAFNRESGRVVEQSIQQLGLSSLDPSLKTQAATAGIQAARNLLSRKVRQQRVVLKSGYRVFLKAIKSDSHQH